MIPMAKTSHATLLQVKFQTPLVAKTNHPTTANKPAVMEIKFQTPVQVAKTQHKTTANKRVQFQTPLFGILNGLSWYDYCVKNDSFRVSYLLSWFYVFPWLNLR